MTKLGQDLIEAANEALDIARGEADPSTYNVYVPQEIDVAGLRGELRMTQKDFANRFGFSLSAVRDWEQKRRTPEQSARVLLLVIKHSPAFVDEALKASIPPREEAVRRVTTNTRRVSGRGKAKLAAKNRTPIRA